MHLVHEEGQPPKNSLQLITRFTTVFLVLVGFYIIIFNLVIEWIGYFTDDSITILSIILGFVIIRKHAHNLTDYKIFKRMNELSETFLDRVFETLESKKKIFIALSSILVLHFLTDFIVFILPFFSGQTHVGYLGALQVNHPTIFWLASADISLASGLDKIVLFYLYSMELIAIIFLMMVPLYIWWLYYSGRDMKLYDSVIAGFFAALVPFILAPIFKLSELSEGAILGVDIHINPISFAALFRIQYIMLASLMVFIVLHLAVHYSKEIKKFTVYALFLPVAGFMVYYIYLFLADLSEFYIKSIRQFLQQHAFFFLFYFALFCILTVLFYIIGTGYFLYEAEKKLGYFAEHPRGVDAKINIADPIAKLKKSK